MSEQFKTVVCQSCGKRVVLLPGKNSCTLCHGPIVKEKEEQISTSVLGSSEERVGEISGGKFPTSYDSSVLNAEDTNVILAEASKRRSAFTSGSISILLGVMLWVFTFGGLSLLRGMGIFDNELTSKLLDRGWTCYVAGFMSFIAVGMLLVKLIRRSKRNLILEKSLVLQEIQASSLPEVYRKIVDFSKSFGDVIIGYRLKRAIERYSITRNLNDSTAILVEENETDETNLHDSYSFIRTSLWAIPILGFIGTVIGVGNAVGGFASFISASQKIEDIKAGLQEVTGGLAVAFDTTLVALVFSIAVMLCTYYVEQKEQDQLKRIDEVCKTILSKQIGSHTISRQATESLDMKVAEELSIIINDAAKKSDTRLGSFASASDRLESVFKKTDETLSQASKTMQEGMKSFEASSKVLSASIEQLATKLEEEAGERQKTTEALCSIAEQLQSSNEVTKNVLEQAKLLQEEFAQLKSKPIDVNVQFIPSTGKE